MTTQDRGLAALGFDGVPALRPLTYPGRPVGAPSLLTGAELLPLRARPGGPGAWAVGGHGPRRSLDAVLTGLGQAPVAERRPVIAVGSNASPGQVTHKLAGLGLSCAVPMVPVRLRGIGVGCSAHIGRAGYVAAAPYPDPTARRALVVSWLDAAQLAAVDGTELPNYRRVWLPGVPYEMALPGGTPLDGAYLYVSARGVLADPATGLPRPGGGDQAALLDALLAASPALRALLGPDAAAWVRRAAADAALRERGTQLFAAAGWVLPLTDLPTPLG
ncbi:hypothetical protein [Streptomyces kanamyceticus]|uniref:Uncharacterized protein n=1 Tax=Streptomyces kanamyceticus TaxID=1967 RepID=A0A5J6GD36_STRKN|nr:hypothetical protein [Streptomyces kanamyceticus]QEU91771.1 hypothetical protein CP970_13545 [Streptomyces kanamyceticus]